MEIRATSLCNLQHNNVARQVARFCCAYFRTGNDEFDQAQRIILFAFTRLSPSYTVIFSTTCLAIAFASQIVGGVTRVISKFCMRKLLHEVELRSTSRNGLQQLATSLQALLHCAFFCELIHSARA